MMPILNFADWSALAGKLSKVACKAAISFENAAVQFAVLSMMNSTFGKSFAPAGLPANRSMSSARSDPWQSTNAAAARLLFADDFIFYFLTLEANGVVLGLRQQHADSLPNPHGSAADTCIGYSRVEIPYCLVERASEHRETGSERDAARWSAADDDIRVAHAGRRGKHGFVVGYVVVVDVDVDGL